MNKSIFALVAIAFIGGMMLGSPTVSAGTFDFVAGNSADDEERPHGFERWFIKGDIVNECAWDIINKEECQRGILFDNQENINQKLNWLLQEHGYDFSNIDE